MSTVLRLVLSLQAVGNLPVRFEPPNSSFSRHCIARHSGGSVSDTFILPGLIVSSRLSSPHSGGNGPVKSVPRRFIRVYRFSSWLQKAGR